MKIVAISGRKLLLTIIALVLLVVALVVFIGAGVNAASAKTDRKLPIYYVKTTEKKIAISFDCAWGVDYTDSLLETMERENVKCTFFAVEFWTVKYPEYVKKIIEKGHEMGTHSATHPYMSKLTKEQIKSELTTSREKIEEITGKKVEVFRPPYGDYNDLLIETAREQNLYTVQWSVDSLDWKNLSAEEIKTRVLSRADCGSIVLFHNQGLHTAEALPDIIKELKSRGFTFVSIGELIYHDNYVMEADGGQKSLAA